MNGFKSKSFSKEILNQPLRGVFLLALAATLALPLTSLAGTSYTISDYPNQDAGDWSQGATVTGPPDGSCRGLGATGNVNEVYDFSFAFPDDADITGIEAYVLAVSQNTEDVRIQLTLDHDDPLKLIGAQPSILGVVAAGKGNCASANESTVGPALSAWYLDTYPGGGTQLADDIAAAGALFGIVFTTLENSSVKLDSVCLEITYESSGDSVTSTSCFAEPEPTATLTLLKAVTNNSGGNAVPSDFTLILNGGAYTDTVFDHEGEPLVVVGQTYTLSEVALDGYTQTGPVVCVDIAAQGATVTHPVTMVAGQDVECTITNTFNPPPPPPPPSIAVPTLSQWALILLAMLVLGVGLYSRREHRSRH